MSLFSRIIQMSKPSARRSSLVAGMSSLTVKLGLVLFFSSYSILFHFCTSSYRFFLFLLFFLFPSAMPFNFSYTEEFSITICQEEQKASSQAVIITIRIISGP